MKINKEAFERVCLELEDDTKGNHLTFDQIGEIFGQDFWVMLVGTLLDAREAARIISSAVNRLRNASLN